MSFYLSWFCATCSNTLSASNQSAFLHLYLCRSLPKTTVLWAGSLLLLPSICRVIVWDSRSTGLDPVPATDCPQTDTTPVQCVMSCRWKHWRPERLAAKIHMVNFLLMLLRRDILLLWGSVASMRVKESSHRVHYHGGIRTQWAGQYLRFWHCGRMVSLELCRAGISCYRCQCRHSLPKWVAV